MYAECSCADFQSFCQNFCGQFQNHCWHQSLFAVRRIFWKSSLCKEIFVPASIYWHVNVRSVRTSYKYMYACMHACMYVCMYVCMCMHVMCIYVCIYAECA
jgi:hypothetical protein